MRVANIHGPQAGVDVTNMPTERQTRALRRQVTPSLLHASGTWTMTERVEEETPDNTKTADEDDHADDRENQEHVSQPHAPRAWTTSPSANPTTPAARPEDGTSEPNPKTSTVKRKSSHDADENPSDDDEPNDELKDELDPLELADDDCDDTTRHVENIMDRIGSSR